VNIERLNEEEDKWEGYGSIYVWQLILRREISRHKIAGWGKKE
jgi:hypothetical protein